MCKYCEMIKEKNFSDPMEGDLRIWWVPQFPCDQFYWPISNALEGKHVLDMLAMYDIFQFEHKIKPDYSNTGGLEVFEDGEWCDWQNEDGDSIYDVDFIDAL